VARQPAEIDIDALQEVLHERKRKSLPFVWIVPLVAAVIGGWLVVQGIMEKGPTITILFKTAEGLEAGKTKVKYKSVDVGEVKHISVAKDLLGVVATVELVKNAEPFLVEDTQFWVVRPRIAGGQVSGLGTLFSGSYIGGDIGKSTTKRRDFVGLEVPPIITAGMAGRHFVLHAETLGSLQVGSPVFFRQEEVGSIVAHEINKDGQGVTFRIFVNAPYDQYVNANSRFWNASGVDVTMDANGIRVDTESLVSILIGGVAFGTFPGIGPQSSAEENQEFTLFNSRMDAMKRPDALTVPMVVIFEQSLRGLSVGAPVEFRGVGIGEVKSINMEYDLVQSKPSFPVGLAIYPMRLLSLMTSPLNEKLNAEEVRRARWSALVARGLRAQLKTGNLLTGQVLVELDFFPNAPKAEIDWASTPPRFPTVPSTLEEVQESLVSIVKKIDKMPLDQIGTDLHQTLQSLNGTLHTVNAMVKRVDTEITPAARQTLEESRQMFQTTQRALAPDAPLQHDVRDALRELSKASQSVRLLGDYLERHPESILRGKK